MELTPDELEALIARGVKSAFVELGLKPETAAEDLSELRRLLESWRTVKRGALSEAGRIAATLLLAAILLAIGVKAKLLKLAIG